MKVTRSSNDATSSPRVSVEGRQRLFFILVLVFDRHGIITLKIA